MSVSLTNNATGGTNAATLTYGNCGATSGEAWDYMSFGTGGTMTYANNPARGNLSYKFTTGATATQAFVAWQFADMTTVYIRFYIFLATLPAVSTRVCEVNDGVTKLISIGVRADGTISVRDSAEAAMLSSITGIPVGRWVRVEAKLVSHATAGSAAMRLYREADSPYPTEKMTSAATFNTKPATNYIQQVRFGIVGTNVSNTTAYIDDMAASDVDYLGPADPVFAPSLLRSNNAETGSNGATVTALNSGDSVNNYFQFVEQDTDIQFSNAQSAHGTLSYVFTSASGVENRITWRSMATSAAALRLYAYFTALPPSATGFALFTTNANEAYDQLVYLKLRADGHVIVTDRTTATIWASAGAISLNTWYRFELFAQIGGTPTTGTVNAAYYSLDSGTAIDSFTTSAADLGSVNISWARFGKLSANTWTDTFYMDELAVVQNASGYIGAYSGPPSPPAVFAGVIPHNGWGNSA